MSTLLLAVGQIAWWLSRRLIIDCVILSPFLVLFVHYQSRRQNVTKRQWFRDQGIQWLGKGMIDKILPERKGRREFYMVRYRNPSNTSWISDFIILRDNDKRPEKESLQMQEPDGVVKARPTRTETNDKILREGTGCEDRTSRPAPNDSSSPIPADQTTIQEHPVRISGERPAIKPGEQDNTVDRTRDERSSTESELGWDKTRPGPPLNTAENSRASVREFAIEPETLQEALDALDAEDARFEDAEAEVQLKDAGRSAAFANEVEKEVLEPEKDNAEGEDHLSAARQESDTHTISDEKPPADTTSNEKEIPAPERGRDTEPHTNANLDEDAAYDAESEQDLNSYHEESTKDFLDRISKEHNLDLDLKTKFPSPKKKKEKFDVQADFDNAPRYNGDSREAIERRNRLFANPGLKVKEQQKVKKGVKSELDDGWHRQNLEEADSEDDGDEEDWEDVDSGAGSRWNGTGMTWSEVKKEVVSGIRWWSNGAISSMGV